jgi:predicted nucleic acid-binding protein
MKRTFADSFFFLAMMNVRDSRHLKAVEFSQSLAGPIVTTQWVLVEVADAFSKPRDRDRFVDLLELIEADERMQVVAASNSTFRRGTELFARRNDKSWSLTDCISFVVMEQLDIDEALTGDHHYAQAGFTPLLKPSDPK